MAVKLKDVAKRAGVSPTAVSLVLNQTSNSRISQKTREKILQAAQELGYQSSKVTQSIPQTIPPTIALVITDITNPFFTELAAIIEDVASRYGYNILLCNTQESTTKESEYLEVLRRRRIDGLLIAPAEDQNKHLQEFLKKNIPVVFVDRCLETTEASVVLIDNVQGAYLAVEYLLRLGHRRIGLIKGREHVTTGKERLQGYLEALKEYHVKVDDRLICDGQFTIEGGQRATAELLGLSPPPSAIFSTGGVMTIGVLMELKKQGVNIPHDLSLVSFDDEIWTQLFEPPLTVVSQPVYEIGREATQLLIQLIQGWGQGKSQKIVLQPELIIRQSCEKYVD